MMKRSEKVLQYELPLLVKPQKIGGFVATCQVWRDCYAQGETIGETILEVTAVAQTLIELYREEGLPIPLKFQQKRTVANTFILPIVVSA